MEKTLYLIRHGESEQNIANVMSGMTNTKISASGIQQCKRLSAAFMNKKIDFIFSSPLDRAIQSAKLIFPEFKERIIVSDFLREFNYGTYEGHSRDNYLETEDKVIDMWLNSPSNLTFPDGDNINKHTEFVYSGVLQTINKYDGQNLVYITHRTTIRLLIAKFLNLNLDYFRRIPCSNCSVTKLQTNQDKFTIESINITVDGI